MALVVYQGSDDNLLKSSTSFTTLDAGNGRFVGLSNQGATCYLNGLLQTLFMTPEFRKAIFAWNYDPNQHGAEEWCITLQLQRLFGLLQLSKQRAVDTIALTHSFGWEGSEVFQQQDVQELTRVLFDALEETFKGTAVETIIDDLYAGELIDYLRCIDVDYQSERVDKFLDFSLAIVPFGSEKPMHSLTECIECFLRPEILDGDNKYYAEKFDKKVDAIKGLKFGKLPQIMSVQLKRFVYDFSGPTIVQKKLNDVVKFPMILDMNRYVGKKSSGTQEADAEVGNEFELFLQAQMELLKSQREGGKGDQGNSEKEAAERAPETTAPVPVYAEVVSTTAVPVLISEAPDYEDPFGVSDLEGGMKTVEIDDAPAVAVAAVPVEESDSSAPAGASDAADAGIVYASMSAEEVADLVRRRGEWVYELYAVLIHSGVINGGHYYAYIKDLATQRWWNFNDSTVTSIDEQTVQETWGKKNTYQPYSTYGVPSYYGTSLYNRPIGQASSSFSSANAYMLMYRKVSSGSGAAGSPLVTDDMVPQYIRDLVEKEAREAEERRRVQEEERNKLTMKVYFNGAEHTVRTTRTTTYAAFLTQLWEELGVKQHLGEILPRYLQRETAEREAQRLYEAVDGASSAREESTTTPGCGADDGAQDGDAHVVAVEATPVPPAGENDPCFDLFRLRNYNSFTQLKTDAFEYESSGSLSLDALNFRDHRTFLLETRSGDEDWEVYFADGISMLVLEYEPETVTFKEPRNMRVRRTATLGEVRKMIAAWTTYPIERLRLMKIINCGYNDAQLDILENDEARLREDLGIYEGYKLYIEEVSVGVMSKAYDAFLKARNTIEVRLNKPPELEFEHYLKVDLRWTVPQLRQEVARHLGIDEGVELRIFKQSLRGQELRDGTSSLAVSGIYANICLAVGLGKATPPGFFNVCLVEYTAKENRVGVVELPPLEPEVEVEEVLGMVAPDPIIIPDDTLNAIAVAFEQESPPALEPIPLSDCPPGVYADYNAELNAALDAAASDQASVQSNAGVADDDELQLYDDDIGAFDEDDANKGADEGDLSLMIVGTAAVRHAPTTIPDESSSCDSFDAVAAKIAQNSDALTAECSLKLSDAGQASRCSPAVAVSAAAVCAIPIVDVAYDSDIPELVAITPPPEASAPPFESTPVIPSDFGEKMVTNSLSAAQFQPIEGADSIFLQNNSTFLEVKTEIVRKLVALGRLPADASPYRIRIRDKLGNNPGKILVGDGTFADSMIYLYDSKVLAFQVLEHEERLPELEMGSAVALVQRWNRAEWRLEERFEVLLRGNSSIRDIARGLSLLTDIPLDSMQAIVVPKDTEFLLSDLHLKSPPRNYGRAWFDPSKEQRLLRSMSHEMRLTDGDVLLLQDTSEPLKVLSAEDHKSIEIVRVASNGSGFVDFWAASNSGPSTHASSRNPFDSSASLTLTSSAKSRHGNGSNGVHIRTQRDRQQEASDRSQGSLSSVAVLTGDDSGTPSSAMSPLPPLEAAEADYCANNIDVREFQKAGGIALFDDIN